MTRNEGKKIKMNPLYTKTLKVITNTVFYTLERRKDRACQVETRDAESRKRKY